MLVPGTALALVLLPCLFTEAEAAAPSYVTVSGRQIPSGYYLASGSSTASSAKPSGGYNDSMRNQYRKILIGENVNRVIPGDMDGDSDKDTDDAVYLLLHVMFGATDYPI